MGCSAGGFKRVTLILANVVPSFETVAIVRVIVKGRHCLEDTPGLIVWPGWLAGRWPGHTHLGGVAASHSFFLSLSLPLFERCVCSVQ